MAMRCWMTFAATVALSLVDVNLEARSPVKVHTEVTRPVNNLDPVTITVRNEAGDTLMCLTGRRGSFRFELPERELYLISFDQPHSVEKQVTIDARDASESAARKLDFEVVLEPDPEERLSYTRPSGNIALQGERMRVERERTVPVPSVPLEL